MKSSAHDDIIICRCSDVTRSELHTWIDHGIHSFEHLKRLTRVTMGPCQGRTCRQLVTQELAAKTGVPVHQIDIPVFRQPLKGITLGAIADLNVDALCDCVKEEGKPS
jgi:NAD(P)H-nitrite reductase large subunit